MVMERLNACRDEVIPRVAVALQPRMPMVHIPAWATDKAALHAQHMLFTAERFHDILRAGATLDWSLVANEFAWAGCVLERLGLTWEHQEWLITTYFAVALGVCDWSAEEQAALKVIAEQVRQVAQSAYCDAPRRLPQNATG